MTAIPGGLGAALCFAISTLCSSRSTRLVGASSAVAWTMLTGLAVAAPAALAGGVPAGLGASAGWLAVSGLGNVAGLLLAYRALQHGAVGLVAPIVSTEGAVAALLAIAAGEPVGAATGAALAVIVAGITVAGAGPAGRRPGGDGRAVALALLAAGAFGASLYATGRVSGDLPVLWAVLPARLAGAVAVALPLALSGRLRLTRRAFPLVVAAGLSELGGFAAYALGARQGIAISAVLASQFAALAAVGAFLLFGERLGRSRTVAVVAIAAGVGALSGLQA